MSQVGEGNVHPYRSDAPSKESALTACRVPSCASCGSGRREWDGGTRVACAEEYYAASIPHLVVWFKVRVTAVLTAIRTMSSDNSATSFPTVKSP